MKIRDGFVSNSSSSSFLIARSRLTDEQVDKIVRHIEVALENGWCYPRPDFYGTRARKFDEKNGPPPCFWPDEWDIEANEHEVRGSTSMDNFDMERFLELIGVDMSHVEYSSDG